MTYAFTFDASSCSGCKACQAACKDKNQLPVGVLWRRVVEVNGGTWTNAGAGSPRPGLENNNGVGRPGPYTVWTNTVFAYNISIACNHCEHPKCAGVCPVDAYVIRPDGIVYIDESKCVGCGYCAWACPYDAPQYNPELGHMTKCNFCFDNIDEGNPPACVAACPLRVLNFVEIEEQRLEIDGAKEIMELWKIPASEHPFPLPTYSRTQPHLIIKPHAAMNSSAEKKLANYEEVHPRKESAWAEIPLVIFTLLAQLSVGAFWFAILFLPKPLTILPLSIIGISLGLGMFFSFAHLGTKKNAWRVLNHLGKSWLSREILSASLFGAGWLAVMAESLVFKQTSPLLAWFTALIGFLLIHSMANVYRIPAKPAWNTWRTNAVFFISAVLLGLLSIATVIQMPDFSWRLIGWVVIALLALQWNTANQYPIARLQIAINLLALAVATFTFLFAQPSFYLHLAAFLVVTASEIIKRWKFYQQPQKF